MTDYTHGIVAVSPHGKILHFAGFHEEPDTPEWEILDAELGSDILGHQEYSLLAASSEVLKRYNER